MPFEKGKFGNPGGRPKVVGEVQTLAREYSEEAISALRDIIRDKKAPPAARCVAANSILDRGYGRPSQTIKRWLCVAKFRRGASGFVDGGDGVGQTRDQYECRRCFRTNRTQKTWLARSSRVNQRTCNCFVRNVEHTCRSPFQKWAGRAESGSCNSTTPVVKHSR